MTRTNEKLRDLGKLHVKPHGIIAQNHVHTLRPWFKKAAVAFTAVVSHGSGALPIGSCYVVVLRAID